MVTVCDGSKVVVRFSPFSAPKLAENAEDTHAEDVDLGHLPPRYGVSVIAVECLNLESIEEAVERICRSTSLGGKTVAFTTQNALRVAGFELEADPTENDPNHHLIGERSFSALPNVEVLASILGNGRMNNPAKSKGSK